MNRHRWNLSDVVLLVAFAAIAFAAYRSVWEPSTSPSARPYLAR